MAENRLRRVRKVGAVITKLRGWVRAGIAINCRMSAYADRLAQRWAGRTSGMEDFSTRVLPGLLRPGMRVLDVGGGRAPCLNAATVQRLGLHVTGADISPGELSSAPAGSYHATIVGDVGAELVPVSYDLILSRAVLEHVADTRVAITNLAAALAEGGVMAHFIPCGNAPFAVLNRLLGERRSQRLLWSIYPETVGIAGFPAFYRNCVPSRMAALCRENGLEFVDLQPFFASDYLRFCAPAHVLDMCRQVLLQALGATDFAETFVIVARKPAKQMPGEGRSGTAAGGVRAA
jgi:SAM-dependent methyltransferase